ncbi:MAG: type II toxin-antitoxin system Phd/YefM family antitoxin [Holosporales bacterium]|jgi:prevent-host-death family protein
MLEIGAFEVKNRFSEVLRWVEGGDDVHITRHGKVVAVLMAPEQGLVSAAKQKPEPDHQAHQLWELEDEIAAIRSEIRDYRKDAEASALTEQELAEVDKKFTQHYMNKINTLRLKLDIAELERRRSLILHSTSASYNLDRGFKLGFAGGAITTGGFIAGILGW